MISIDIRSHRASVIARSAVAAATVLAVLLSGCSDKKKDKAASQTAARVNKEEITVHQINFVLQQQRGLAPAQAASAAPVVLERLIDQELTLQKAQEQKLDRDPRVVQQIDAARRDIVSRAYVEKIGSGAPKPSPEEVKTYYEQNAQRLAGKEERRIYSLQELAIEAKPEQLAELRAKLQAAKDLNEFINYLKTNDFRFAGNQAVKPAEQLPMASLAALAKLKDGQALFNAAPNGAQVVVLAGSRMQPVDEERARPAIEQFLLNERKRKVIEDDLKALRSASKIEYVGDFAKGSAKPASAPSPTEVKATTSPLVSKPASAVEPIMPVRPASMPTGNTLDKGIKGLK